VLALAGLAILGISRPAAAQPPSQRPPVSPYINLAKPNVNPGIEYYGNIRPQLTFYSNIYKLQQQEAVTQQAVVGLETPTILPPTGHAVGFQTHLRYYQTVGRPGQVAGGSFSGGAGAIKSTARAPGGR
jgi:hypothetical protein